MAELKKDQCGIKENGGYVVSSILTKAMMKKLRGSFWSKGPEDGSRGQGRRGDLVA